MAAWDSWKNTAALLSDSLNRRLISSTTSGAIDTASTCAYASRNYLTKSRVIYSEDRIEAIKCAKLAAESAREGLTVLQVGSKQSNWTFYLGIIMTIISIIALIIQYFK